MQIGTPVSAVRAHEEMFAYCLRMKRQADGEWNTPQRAGARNIHESHRQAVRILLLYKKIAKEPEWMDTMVATEEIQPDCPRCMAEIKKGQPLCVACGEVINPVIALEKNLIDEHHISLERLTRADVEALGISAFVAETADERPNRLKEGKPKPLSQFELRQQRALAEEKALSEKQRLTAEKKQAAENQQAAAGDGKAKA